MIDDSMPDDTAAAAEPMVIVVNMHAPPDGGIVVSGGAFAESVEQSESEHLPLKTSGVSIIITWATSTRSGSASSWRSCGPTAGRAFLAIRIRRTGCPPT